MGRVCGPNPEKKLRNVKVYSIPSKRATFYGGQAPLPASSEPSNTDQKSCFFALAAFLRRDNVVRKPPKKSGALDLYFFFPKLKNLLKSVDGARRTELRSTIGEKGGPPKTLPEA